MVNVENKRMLIKRSSVAGVTPSFPGSGVTSIYDHTLGFWTDNMLYGDGELFLNIADKKLWISAGDEMLLLGYSGMTPDFIELGDTPTGYTSYAGYSIVVNGTEDGLTFQQIAPVNNFTDLLDTPGTYVGYDGYMVTVDETNSGLTYTSMSSLSGITLQQLIGFPGYVSGSTGDVLVLNATADGLNWTTLDVNPTLQDVMDNGSTCLVDGALTIDLTDSFEDLTLVNGTTSGDSHSVVIGTDGITINSGSGVLTVPTDVTGTLTTNEEVTTAIDLAFSLSGSVQDLQSVLDNGSLSDITTDIEMLTTGYFDITTGGEFAVSVEAETNDNNLYLQSVNTLNGDGATINIQPNIIQLSTTTGNITFSTNGGLQSIQQGVTGTIALIEDVTGYTSSVALQQVLDNGTTFTDTNSNIELGGISKYIASILNDNVSELFLSVDESSYIRSTDGLTSGQISVSPISSQLSAVSGDLQATITAAVDGTTTLTNTDGTNTNTFTQAPTYTNIDTIFGDNSINIYNSPEEDRLAITSINVDGEVSFQISATDGATFFYDDRTTKKGIEYFYYHPLSGLTDNSLITKAHAVELLTGITESQDLQSVLDNGSEADISSGTFSISGTSSYDNNWTGKIELNNGTPIIQSENASAQIINKIFCSAEEQYTIIGAYNSDNSTYVEIKVTTTEGNTIIVDGRTTPTGIEYGGDYRDTFTEWSLVDKGYVDSVLSPYKEAICWIDIDDTPSINTIYNTIGGTFSISYIGTGHWTITNTTMNINVSTGIVYMTFENTATENYISNCNLNGTTIDIYTFSDSSTLATPTVGAARLMLNIKQLN